MCEREWENVTVEEVWDMPSVFVGSVGQIGEDMARRREELGFSYFIVTDEEINACAPVVERMAGG
jgi:hypothetical protein